MKLKQKSGTTDMTVGVEWKQILLFAVPVLFGNIFQQLYNTADSLIVGNLLGSNALAAVSSSGSLLEMMIGFFNGMAMGAGIVIARYFGAKDKEQLHLAIHTDIAFSLLFGVCLSIVGVLLSPILLRLMGTPEEMFAEASSYFRIYFSGMVLVAMYNTFVGIMQSMGDSRYPVFCLVIASILNVILDFLFVGVFHWGVGAAALATVLSQGFSAVLCFIRLMNYEEGLRIVPRDIRIHRDLLKQIAGYGLPSGIGNSITSLGNVIMQTNINQFGVYAVAGCGVYSKIDGFTFLPITCFSMALATFVGQNLGAGKKDRVKTAIRFALPCGIVLAECMGVLIYATAPVLVGLFNDNPEVIYYGVLKARTQAPFFYALAATHCMAAVLRGSGKTFGSTMIFMISWCFIRISVVTIMMHFIHSIQVVNWTYPLTWHISMFLSILYMKKSDWIHGFDKKP